MSGCQLLTKKGYICGDKSESKINGVCSTHFSLLERRKLHKKNMEIVDMLNLNKEYKDRINQVKMEQYYKEGTERYKSIYERDELIENSEQLSDGVYITHSKYFPYRYNSEHNLVDDKGIFLHELLNIIKKQNEEIEQLKSDVKNMKYTLQNIGRRI